MCQQFFLLSLYPIKIQETNERGVREVEAVSAELISVIRVRSTAGDGTENDPIREVVDYFLPNGTQIAHKDSFKPF